MRSDAVALARRRVAGGGKYCVLVRALPAVVIALIMWFGLGSAPALTTCPNEALRAEQGSTGLPDCRAYELVSPPDKNGGEVIAAPSFTRAAQALGSGEPMALQFNSLEAFSDASGIGAASAYMSERDVRPGTSGWSTHGITPTLGSDAEFREETGQSDYQGEFSPDLARGVFYAGSPLTNVPNVEDVGNLYLRDDLRAAGAGSYALLSNAFAPIGSETNPFFNAFVPRMVGASDGFGHVLVESQYNLTADAPPQPSVCVSRGRRCQPRLYEWSDGVLTLAGVRPDGTPAASSQAGQSTIGSIGNGPLAHMISSDGARVFFTEPASGNSGTLYARLNGGEVDASTVQVNASERTDCAEHDPCNHTPEPDPAGPQPATYWGASANGARAFFTSPERLTDDATPGGEHLYMYDMQAPSGHRLTLIDRSEGSEVNGVIGVSDDGGYVYFFDARQLVSGAPPVNGEYGIFVWHDTGTPGGALAYVGAVTVLDVGEENDAVLAIERQARVTPDGRHLLFSSHSGVGLTGYDHGDTCQSFGGHCQELYVYNAEDGRLACASCNPTGAAATASAEDMAHGVIGGASRLAGHVSHALSDDGRYVFFTTAEALVPQDTNGVQDAYEYDVGSGEAHLLSSGRNTSPSFFLDAGANGEDAFFATREPLVGWDVDANYDVYDARIDGGLPNPPPPAPGCAGEGCQGPLSAPPSIVPPGSSGASSAGNLIAPPAQRPVGTRRVPRCARGFVHKRVRGRTRCVLKRKPRKRAGRADRSIVKNASRRAGL